MKAEPTDRGPGNPVGGLAYLLFVSTVFSATTGAPFWFTLLGLCAATGFSTWALLFWLTRWARRKESRHYQFGLATLLLGMTLLGMFLACMRWIIPHLNAGPVSTDPWFFLVISTIFLTVLIVAMLATLPLANEVIWACVWLVQRWRRGQAPRSVTGETSRDAEKTDSPIASSGSP